MSLCQGIKFALLAGCQYGFVAGSSHSELRLADGFHPGHQFMVGWAKRHFPLILHFDSCSGLCRSHPCERNYITSAHLSIYVILFCISKSVFYIYISLENHHVERAGHDRSYGALLQPVLHSRIRRGGETALHAQVKSINH